MLGAIASLAGVIAQANAQAAATNVAYQNLFETKRANRKQEDIATSSRTDAYGNMVSYDPILKRWTIKVTPTTRAILTAEQAETLKSLTEDAARDREAAIRRDNRSREADDLFNEEFNNYRYRDRRSEGEYVGDAQQLLLNSRRKGLDEAASVINKQLIRTGNSSRLPEIFNESAQMYADSLEDAMLRGKMMGQENYRSAEGNDDARWQQTLGFLAGLAGDTVDSQQLFTNLNQELAGRSDSALGTLLGVLGQGEGRRASAMANVQQAVGQSPDFGSLASSLNSLGSNMRSAFSGRGTITSPSPVTRATGSVAAPTIPIPLAQSPEIARQRAYLGF